MGRVARIVVLALPWSRPGWSPNWPRRRRRTSQHGGHRTTDHRAYDVCCARKTTSPVLVHWATSYDGIASHYERIKQLNPAITGHASNDAVTGAKMATAPTQVGQAVGQGRGM